MSTIFDPRLQGLRDATLRYVRKRFEPTSIKTEESLAEDVPWQPSIQFDIPGFVAVAIEVSDAPYPQILKLVHADLLEIGTPICVYAACPAEAYLKSAVQRDVSQLRQHGFGLITIEADLSVIERVPCIPLIQHISPSDFDADINGAPKKLRARLRRSFDKYQQEAKSGLNDLGELIEGFVDDVVDDRIAKGELARKVASATLAKKAEALIALPTMARAMPELTGVRHFVHEFRNAGAHNPRTKSAALKRLRSSKRGFMDGVNHAVAFQRKMAGMGVRVRC